MKTTTLRSSPTMIFLAKGGVPFLCAVFAIELLTDHGNFFIRNLFLACPFIIAALFGVSVAAVEISGGVVRYRRFLRWKEITPEKMACVRIEWAPFLGSIQLKKLIFPWGRLYFVLDRNLSPNPFAPGKYPLLSYIRNIVEGQEPAEPPAGKNGGAGLSLIALAVGVLLYPLLLLVSPSLASKYFLPQYTPRHSLLEMQYRIIHLIGRFEIQLAFFLLFAFLAIHRRQRPRAWIFAFLTGFSLPYFILHWLKLG